MSFATVAPHVPGNDSLAGPEVRDQYQFRPEKRPSRGRAGTSPGCSSSKHKQTNIHPSNICCQTKNRETIAKEGPSREYAGVHLISSGSGGLAQMELAVLTHSDAKGALLWSPV